jgi:hypothetical protein
LRLNAKQRPCRTDRLDFTFATSTTRRGSVRHRSDRVRRRPCRPRSARLRTTAPRYSCDKESRSPPPIVVTPVWLLHAWSSSQLAGCFVLPSRRAPATAARFSGSFDSGASSATALSPARPGEALLGVRLGRELVRLDDMGGRVNDAGGPSRRRHSRSLSVHKEKRGSGLAELGQALPRAVGPTGGAAGLAEVERGGEVLAGGGRLECAEGG